jgi:hypothetical protein
VVDPDGLARTFEATFGRATGRVNLTGDHTDLDTLARIAERTASGTCR